MNSSQTKILIIALIVMVVLAVSGLVVCLVLMSQSSNPSPGISPEQPGISEPLPPVDPLVGTWHGHESLMFGMASADFTMTARDDGTMTISGTASASIAGIDSVPFTTEASWVHTGGSNYVGSIGDQSLPFTCDGSTVTLSANPYQMGLVDMKIADIDINLKLTRQ